MTKRKFTRRGSAPVPRKRDKPRDCTCNPHRFDFSDLGPQYLQSWWTHEPHCALLGVAEDKGRAA